MLKAAHLLQRFSSNVRRGCSGLSVVLPHAVEACEEIIGSSGAASPTTGDANNRIKAYEDVCIGWMR